MAKNTATRPKRRLSLLDASFLYGESAVNPTHVGSILVLEGEIPFDRVWQHLRERQHISPRFRQRLIFPPFNLARATVEEDPDFKLENHVHHHKFPNRISEAEAIREIVRMHFGRVMDRSRPLWDFTLFEGLPGRSLLVWAMHHALVDGVSAFDLLNRLMDFTPHPPAAQPPPEEWKPAPLPTPQESMLEALRDIAIGQIDSLTRAASALINNPSSAITQLGAMLEAGQLMSEMAQPPVATPWNAGPAVGGRHLAHLAMPFADFRAIRAAFGGTINDIVLTVLAEGAARYLEFHRWPAAGKLRFGCPVNVRRPEEQVVLENRVSMMSPETPAQPMDLLERLKLMSAETARIKRSGAPYIMERMSAMGEMVPAPLMAAMSDIGALGMELTRAMVKAAGWKPSPDGPKMPPAGINFVATNVPGPQTPWFFAGYRVRDSIGLLPLGGNLGYGVAITSYDQHITFSMMADDLLMPDVEKMRELVADAFYELRRQVPAEMRETLSLEPRPRAA